VYCESTARCDEIRRAMLAFSCLVLGRRDNSEQRRLEWRSGNR
jgi:hypothetical protein